eukprot:maker-scaffold_1-snap-gene-23.24-mRNA-1 protein AED:0.02 eAED:0.02 QI:140/1/1/1/0/0/3/260/409
MTEGNKSSGSNKNRYRSSGATSYQIFMQFVKRSTDNSVDVSQVISKPCFQMWIQTRVEMPKKPEESFRKAVTAHLRGADRRKPFPADVEFELLKLVRKKHVWPAFLGTNSIVGIIGFQGKGHWEKQKLTGIEKPAEENLETQLLALKKRKVKSISTAELFQNEKLTVEKGIQKNNLHYKDSKFYSWNVQAFGENKFSGIPILFAGKHFENAGISQAFNKKHKPLLHQGKRNDLESPACRRMFNAIENKCTKAVQPVANSLKQILLSMKPEQVRAYCEAYAEQLGSGSCNYSPPKDFRPLGDDFHFPKQCKFDTNKLKGVLIGEFLTQTYIFQDDRAREIFRGNIVGVHRAAIEVNKIEALAGTQHWSRAVKFRCDGTLMIEQARISTLSEHLWYAEVQDFTEEFKHLLS